MPVAQHSTLCRCYARGNVNLDLVLLFPGSRYQGRRRISVGSVDVGTCLPPSHATTLSDSGLSEARPMKAVHGWRTWRDAQMMVSSHQKAGNGNMILTCMLLAKLGTCHVWQNCADTTPVAATADRMVISCRLPFPRSSQGRGLATCLSRWRTGVYLSPTRSEEFG